MRRSNSPQASLVLALGLIVGASAHGQSSKGNLIVPPVIITGLPTDRGCSEISFRGRVAKRDFDDKALKITGFVLEEEDGARTFINVFIPDGLSRAAMGNMLNGLQRALKEGRAINGNVQACGSGPVLTLRRVW